MVKQHVTFTNELKIVYGRGFVELQPLFGPEPTLDYEFGFEGQELDEFMAYLEKIGTAAFGRLTVKEAYSEASDYDTYYSRKYDNNGYLSIGREGYRITLVVESPVVNTTELYRFSKPKFQSFLYDMRAHYEAVKELRIKMFVEN